MAARSRAKAHMKRNQHSHERAKDRGCSYPGCDVPGYFCEVHHVEDYAKAGETHIDNLTFGCGSHHPLASNGWTTRKRHDGTTAWIPPAHLDRGQPRTNTFHHPEKLLRADHDDGDDDDDP